MKYVIHRYKNFASFTGAENVCFRTCILACEKQHLKSSMFDECNEVGYSFTTLCLYMLITYVIYLYENFASFTGAENVCFRTCILACEKQHLKSSMSDEWNEGGYFFTTLCL